MVKKLILIQLAFLFPSICLGNLDSELGNFFNKFGSSSNVSSADIYQGQKAGYLTGGGVTVRNRVMHTHPASINLPRFDAGCGGIDIFTGGFSFINDEQLVTTLKSIGSGAVGYAFLLGLETVSPQVANTIKQLQSWTNTVNSTNINSCEQAAGLVGSVWPKDALVKQHVCRSVGGDKGLFADWAASRQECGREQGYDKQNQNMHEDKDYVDLLKDEYNIAWEVLKKLNIIEKDRELAEFFMNLMGTVIVHWDVNTKKKAFNVIESKISDETFLNGLMKGGEISIHTCDQKEGNKCLSVEEKSVVVDPAQAWVGRIQGVLSEMQRKVIDDEELSLEEQDILTKTHLPLYKIVNILTAYKKGYCPIDFYQIADIVAMDLLIQYLREAVELVREGANHLRRAQMYADKVDDYLKDLVRIESFIQYYETRTARQMDREYQLMQKVQIIEDKIAAEIVL